MKIKKADIFAQAPDKIKERIAQIQIIEAIVNEIKDEENCFSLKKLAVTGKDLMEIGIPSGKEIGRILNELFNKVIDGEVQNTKDALMAEVNK